jgi:peptide/nickel transport system permease protein
MVKEARTQVSQIPWALYFPAGAIAVVVIGVNLAADGLKRALQAR